MARALLALLLGLGLAAPVAAAERFAVVPPVAGNPFFEAMREGCTARAQVIDVLCVWATPGAGETRTQAQLIRDLVAEKVDGIALSPGPDPEVKDAIDEAVKAGVPVVTFDGDRPDSLRRAFVGTNARDFGRQLGSSVKRWKPKGGKFAIVSMDPKIGILAERIAGVRDALKEGWIEVAGSPVVIGGQSYIEAVDAYAKLMERPAGEVDAIICVGAWPMLAEDEWRAMIAKVKPRIDRADVVLVVADALPIQKELVKEGLGHVLVGQRPADMGAKVIDVLTDLARGRRAPDIVYVGFDTITRLDLVRAAK
jgi:ribose transport system substrate-binding protein